MVALLDPGSVAPLAVSPWGSPALGVPAILPEARPLVPPRYRLLRRLAAGGTADVYLAQLTGPGGFARHVVLKALRTDASTDLAELEMFLDEARLMAQLCHHGIAQVLEVGTTGDGSYFVAVEHVPGASLQTTLQTAARLGVALPLAFGVGVVTAVARALHHAHGRRRPDGRHLEIVHRDVTPANIMISSEGGVKLIDFGIASSRSAMCPSSASSTSSKCAISRIQGELSTICVSRSTGEATTSIPRGVSRWRSAG